jgi:hypothetical protein
MGHGQQSTNQIEMIHVDVYSPLCEVNRGVFSISSMTRIDVWYIYLMRKNYEMIEIVQFMKSKL